ncbi:MAG: hypothetical protein JNL58_05790 [Planctomyces sp.]|nr:hypothetical protein [Planctomyces sp.]
MTCRLSLIALRLIAAALMLLLWDRGASGQEAVPQSTAALDVVTDDIQDPVRIRADVEERLPMDWGEVRLLIGRVRLEQGQLSVSAAKMAVLSTPTETGYEVLVYGEDISIDHHEGRRYLGSEVIQLQTLKVPEYVVGSSRVAQQTNDPLYTRAIERLFPGTLAPEQHVTYQVTPDSMLPQLTVPGAGKKFRRIQIRQRSSQPIQAESRRSEGTVPEEQIYVITGGVNVLIEGVEFDVQGQQISPGLVDISADRIVAWTQATGDGDLADGGLVVQSADTRFQIYMEGNIVIRHKQNTITASHAFFDANNDRAVMMNAELRAFVPTTGGYFRVRAERMRQLSRDRFHAQNAWATSSPYGKPGYRLQASDIFVEPGAATPWTGTDPLTGQQVVGQSTWVTSLNNQVVVGDTPVFWLPKISAPMEDPGIPIRRATVTQDRIFGLHVKTVWDLTTILGLPRQPGTELDLLANWATDRGPGVGTAARYEGTNEAGKYQGSGTLYYQYDSGLDNLGSDRRALQPESDHRGEITWRHRQQLPGDATLFGEIGFLSDRNYLEQYDETRFDTDKDVETILGVRQDLGAYSGSLWTRPDLNQFEAHTQWLPRADAYSFSQPLFDGLAYWSSHSYAGYADMNQMQSPTDPADPFTPLGLPYMADVSGGIAMTRHQIDAPFMLGPVNVTPYVMGEAAWWESGFSGDSVDRYTINAGIRARLFAWKVMPFTNSEVFNLRGLTHKHETILDYSWTDVSRSVNEIPQWNEIDENSQERFRSRYTTQIYGGVIPDEFNARNYAIRNGAGLWVSAPYHELVDDQQVVRLSFRNRLQTKAGPINAQRTRDWMVWESGLSYFPEADRDNFGEDVGLLFGHYRWNVSDRTSLLADGVMDLFENAQDVWSLGILSQRSTRGSVYVSYRQVEAGDFLDSRILTGSYSYQMSPKWISTASYAYDLGESESRGSSLTVSRVGLDWILHFGLGFDISKDNVGIGISLEPRFGPPNPTNMSYLLGLQR